MMLIDSLSFSWGQVWQLLALAVVAGGLMVQVRQNTKRIETVEKRQNEHEKEFISVMQKLGDDFAKFASELRTVIAVHETRLGYIEKKDDQCEP